MNFCIRLLGTIRTICNIFRITLPPKDRESRVIEPPTAQTSVSFESADKLPFPAKKKKPGAKLIRIISKD